MRPRKRQQSSVEQSTMNSSLVFLLLVASATALPSATNIFKMSLSELQQAAATGRTAHIHRALNNVGALAIDGLSAHYAQAVESLRYNTYYWVGHDETVFYNI